MWEWLRLFFVLLVIALVLWTLRKGIMLYNYRLAIKEARAIMESKECLNQLVGAMNANLESWRKLPKDASWEDRNELCYKILKKNILLGNKGKEIVDLCGWIKEIEKECDGEKVFFELLGTSSEEFGRIVKWFDGNRL